jgi:uncharacterized protein YkwD
MTQKWWGMSIAAAACASLVGCAAGSEDDAFSTNNGVSGPCIPGASAGCVCPDGMTSARTCSADGTSFGLCACGPMAGAGGATNMGQAGIGQAGAAGMGPRAGTMAPMPGGAGTGAGGMAGSMQPTGGSRPPTGGMGVPMAGAGGTMAGSGGGNAGGGGSSSPGDDVPATDHCAPVADWNPAWVAFEEEVLQLVNEYRAMGYNCDTEGQFGAAGPLTTQPNLRCSARLHSQDMAMRDYFAHDNPDGDGPSERMDAAGYMGGTWGENIAMGQRTPQEVVDGWMDSDGHCANIMREQFTQIGVGFYQGSDRSAYYWTQNFGAPARGRP